MLLTTIFSPTLVNWTPSTSPQEARAAHEQWRRELDQRNRERDAEAARSAETTKRLSAATVKSAPRPRLGRLHGPRTTGGSGLRDPIHRTPEERAGIDEALRDIARMSVIAEALREIKQASGVPAAQGRQHATIDTAAIYADRAAYAERERPDENHADAPRQQAAPRPRTFSEIATSYYSGSATDTEGQSLIASSARGGQ